jgi:beta-galactosidase
MKALIAAILIFCCLPALAQIEYQFENLFDFGWRFHRGGAQSAGKPEFDDSGWRVLDLPHDWSLEDLPGTESPFHPGAISQVSGGFTTGGTGWYRKRFHVPVDYLDKRFIIQFDGVYMNAEVWLNGHSLGKHPYGYTTFWYDMTRHIQYGKENVIAVKVMNEGENSRWYSGSGIYRHVWLKVLEPVHRAQWGTYITTPEVTSSAATVTIKTRVNNALKEATTVILQTRIIAPDGNEIAISESSKLIESESESEYEQHLEVPSPVHWSPDTPALYTALQEIHANHVLMDSSITQFGIRTISFDVSDGFMLNGKPFLMKGGCVHHDNGPLGAMAYDRAEERRVELLKASGYNAVRCAHNPPSEAFLRACDRLGMLVIDEAFDMWEVAKNPFDYHLYFREWWKKDIESMVLRDRNHPSVIMWSTGNEIPERGDSRGVKTSQMLTAYIKSLDPTRPVTSAVNGLNPGKDPFFATLDVAGYNYSSGGDHRNESIYEEDHKRVPDRIIYQAESYPLEAFDAWMGTLDYPYVVGDFVWTAFDYIGEASIGWLGYYQENNFYPWNLAWCGDIDICGWKRPQSYYRDALWKENQVSLFVKPPKPTFKENPGRQSWSKWHWHDAVADWNWDGSEGIPLEVTVYSSCQEVELFLNGKSLGKKATGRSTEFMAKWEVPYRAGELKATGISKGKQINSGTLRTAGEPVKLIATADRSVINADGQDLSYISIELQDASGIRHPNAENLVQFEIDGPGEIIAVANANPVSLESYKQPQRKAWQGRCLVVVKSGMQAGTLTLRATSEGMEPAVVKISAE